MGGDTSVTHCSTRPPFTTEQQEHFEQHQYVVTQNNNFMREIYYTGSTFRIVLSIAFGATLTTG